MAGPLDGIKVIEIGQALAGPLAGSILGDMGAEVIKIEKPDGGDDARLWGPPFIEGDALFFHAQNRNKKSVTIDITRADEVARLKTMVQDADIVIQNLRPGVVEKFGIAPEDLLAVNPRLIYCSIWAFGYQGPLRLAPGFDPLLQAYGGLMTLTGRPTDPPTFAGAAVNDKTTGMWCVIGALAGLQQRHSTGQGCVVDTSLFESAVALVEGSVNSYLLNGRVPERTGTASNLLTPYQTFETADRPICIAAGNDRLFVKLAQVMGHPEWSADPRFENGRKRAENRAALVALMDAELSQKPRDHWMALIESVGVPCAPVNDIAEVANSQQLAAMDMLRPLPGTDLKIIGLPISFDRQRPYPRADSPKLGQHNAELKPE